MLRFHFGKFAQLHLGTAFYETIEAVFIVKKSRGCEAFNLAGEKKSAKSSLERIVANQKV
jgi:hypothetical protein